MDFTKWSDFIVPTTLKNADINFNFDDESFNTTDKIFIKSIQEIDRHNLMCERKKNATDYAICKGVAVSSYRMKKHRKTCSGYLTRTPIKPKAKNEKIGMVSIVFDGASSKTDLTNELHYGLVPAMHLDIKKVIEARKQCPQMFEVKEIKNEIGHVLYRTISFGEFPQNIANAKDYVRADEIYYSNPNLSEDCVVQFDGKKYKRVPSIRPNSYDGDFNNGHPTRHYKNVWCEVAPVPHVIVNWNDLPKEINPEGTGKAKFIDVETEDVVDYPSFYYAGVEQSWLWQNSKARGYLNGINVHNIQENGNPKYNAPCPDGNYEGKGLIDTMYGDIDFAYYDTKQNNKTPNAFEKENSRER